MPGFSNITGLESVMFADNASFNGTERSGAMSANAQLWIGDSVAPNVKLGNITSPNGSLAIGYTSPNITIDLNPGVRVSNLGIAYSASTFSITQANGSALSGTNPAFLTIPSRANPGRLIVYGVTANQTFIDSTGASTIIGNLFGLTTGIAFAQDIPFFIYAVSNDAENAVSFMISRMPGSTISPTAAKIGKTGSAVASTQGSFFALGNPTVADYDGNPCVCLGAFRMRMNASNDWAVQALSNGTFATGANKGADGIGCFHEQTKFILATGQFGSAAGSFFTNNGGTAPAFTNQNAGYFINQSRQVIVTTDMDTRIAGAGAVIAQFALPFTADSNFRGIASGNFLNPLQFFYLSPGIVAAQNTVTQTRMNDATAGAGLLNQDFALATTVYAMSITYYANNF